MTWHIIGSAKQSPFARLDLRSKLSIMGMVTLLAFLWESTLFSGGLALGVGAVCLLVGVQRSFLIRVIRTMLPFFVILLLLHGFANTHVGHTPLWTAPQNWWIVGGRLRLTSEGLAFGAMIAFRTLSLVWALPLVIFTTDLNTLVVGLVQMGIAYRVAFVFSATLRFVPTLLNDVQLITEAQRLRGLAVEEMGMLRRLGVYSRIAVPLILGALSRSQATEIALAARAYSGSRERTYLHESRPAVGDYLIMACCFLLVVGAVWLRFTRGVGGLS